MQLPPVQTMQNDINGDVIVTTERERPLILEDNKNRSVIINASGLWRWNLAGYEKNWNGIYRHIISGIAEKLMARRDKDFIAIHRDIYTGSTYRDIPVELDLYSDRLNPDEAFIRLTLSDSTFMEIGRRALDLHARVDPYVFSEKGTYYIIADLFSQGILLESDTAHVVIEENDMELHFSGCNEPALKKLAQNHEGTFQRMNSPDSLEFTVRTEKQWESVSTTFMARKSYWLFAIMFVLICADWIIRKRNGGM